MRELGTADGGSTNAARVMPGDIKFPDFEAKMTKYLDDLERGAVSDDQDENEDELVIEDEDAVGERDPADKRSSNRSNAMRSLDLPNAPKPNPSMITEESGKPEQPVGKGAKSKLYDANADEDTWTTVRTPTRLEVGKLDNASGTRRTQKSQKQVMGFSASHVGNAPFLVSY